MKRIVSCSDCTFALLALSISTASLGAQDNAASYVTWKQINVPAVPADIRISYGSDSLMFGDLRVPAGKGPHPVAIVIHGGCWRAENDLNHISQLSEALRRKGVATWTIEYRRVGNRGGGWPGTFEDVTAGANYLLQVAEKYNLDLERIIVLGHSAGGHLALWLAASRKDRSDAAVFPPLRVPVKSVISLAGVTDLRAFSTGTSYCNASVAPLLGGTPKDVPERYAATSPIELDGSIPALLVHGEADPYVPLLQARDYVAHAGRTGHWARLEIIRNSGHFDLIAPFSGVYPQVERLILAAVPSRSDE